MPDKNDQIKGHKFILEKSISRKILNYTDSDKEHSLSFDLLVKQPIQDCSNR